jgi:MFS family permease
MATHQPPQGYLFSKRYTYYVFGLLCLLMLFDFADRMIVSSLFPFLKQEWGITDTQCGSLVSAVYWAMFIFAVPVSILVDRWSRRKATALMATIWSGASAACALATGYWPLLTYRTAIGIGEAAYAPAGMAMISALFPAGIRSAMIGVFNAFIPIGMAIGMMLGGYIATHWGWRHAFGIVALPGLIVSILFFFVREYKTVALEQTVAAPAAAQATGAEKRKMGTGAVLREFFTKPSLIACYLGFAAMSFQYVSTITFMPSYFTRIQGMPLQKATMLTSSVLLLSLIANPLGGWLADRWLKTNIRARMHFPAMCYIGSGLLGIAAYSVFSAGAGQLVAMLGSTFLLAAAGAGPIAVTQDVVHPGLRAMSYAFGITFQHMLGSAPGPLVTGMLSDKFGLATAMTLVSGVGILSALFLFIGSFYYKRDLDKVEKVALEAEAVR